MHLGFVDVSKAYDSVNRQVLWKKLEKIGICGVFLNALKAMYRGDSVQCVVNGKTSRSVFLRRGLRQGCSLSPMLFALYIFELGADLSTAGKGFTLGKINGCGLLFADDIVLISSSVKGLRDLFRLVKTHCDSLLLEINTGEGKSEVISPGEEDWVLLDGDGEVELSLRKVLEYKYLGLETTSSIVRTCRMKQKKCLNTATKYKFACLHLGKQFDDAVEATIVTWVNIAIPSMLFGCESILFSEANIMEVEKVQSQVAKSVLGDPVSTASVCAQTELGILPLRHVLYKLQLNFYFRVLGLPQSRWVKQALMEHLSLKWPSPYIEYISNIRHKVCLHFVPPTQKYLRTHLFHWSLSEINTRIEKLNLPHVQSLTKLARQNYVWDHTYLDTMAQFRLSNAGLGNRFPRFPGVGYVRRSTCPLCPSSVLSEAHVGFFCPAIEDFRCELRVSAFRDSCQLRGLSKNEAFSRYINCLDCDNRQITNQEILARGCALDTLRGHWLSLW